MGKSLLAYMGRVDRPGGLMPKISEGVSENFARWVSEIFKNFGAKFEFFENFRSKTDIFDKKMFYSRLGFYSSIYGMVC